MRLWVFCVVLAASCANSVSSTPPNAAPAPGATDATNRRFAATAERLYWAHFEFRPQAAIELGYHQYDGKVPDRSTAAIEAERRRLAAARATLEAFEARRLTSGNELDRQVLLAEIRKEQFDLVDRRRPQRDPLYYLFDFGLSPYVDRQYAPLDVRANGLLAACKKAPAYYEQMRRNLEASLPRPALVVGSFLARGKVRLVERVVRPQMKGLPKGALRANVMACLDDLIQSLEALRTDLAARMAKATDKFALGRKRFLRMLAETQGIDVDLATLERIGRADLARNLAAIRTAAHRIDPTKPAREVINMSAADKPADVVAEATRQVKTMRELVVSRSIASIPGTDVAIVRPSPPHRRGNMASLSSTGPFEKRALPSFYYISPPDPAWPAERQRAYVPSRADLLFLSIHEVWPGHFLQGRHIAAHGSRILKSFETYSTSEGWAHYAEEMMWKAGAGNGDPRAHIGQLKNALLRNVRYLVAIGMHCRGMTVQQAITMFREQAFADLETARQQALRGTGDPMYLSYTLGKLIIQKLHRDWRAAKGGSYTMQGFHDAFLRHGEAPLGVIRRMMLGAGAGPVL